MSFFPSKFEKWKALICCWSHEADKMKGENTSYLKCFGNFFVNVQTVQNLDSMKMGMFDSYLERFTLSYSKERGLRLKGTVKLQQLVCQSDRFASRRGSVRTQWEPERCRALLQLKPGSHRFYSLLPEAFWSQNLTLQPTQSTMSKIMCTAKICPDNWLTWGADMIRHSACIICSVTKVSAFRLWQLTQGRNQKVSQFLHTLKRLIFASSEKRYINWHAEQMTDSDSNLLHWNPTEVL